MLRPLLVPVDMGGSPHRCAMAPQRRPLPTPDLVAALVAHYATERRTDPAQPLEVTFFHGGVPSESLLQAAGDHSLRVACLPGDLTPEGVRALWALGVRTLELDVMTFDSRARRGVGRRMSERALRLQLMGLRDLGFRVGVVLAPGLPGSSHAQAVEDAQKVVGDGAPLVDFVRIYPALAWHSAAAVSWVRTGRWSPMTLGQACTTVASLMDILDEGQVPVIRVGIHAGQDMPGRVVAGPHHPGFRAMVETRRYRERMRRVLDVAPRSREAVLHVHPADLSWARGPANGNIRALRAAMGFAGLVVAPSEAVPRGQVVLADSRRVTALESPESA